MSRIDRFLLSDRWCQTWPNCFQMAMSRGLSDHCPLVLSIDVENWGPKPMRQLKCWELLPGYNSFVRDKWQSLQVDGWGGFVLKEKLKLVKLALKEWHQHHTQNLPARISTLKDRIDSFDLKGETTVLCDEEVEELHGFSEELFSLTLINTSICWQQLRVQWLREGDANSKFFHGIMSNRRRRNNIPFILDNGVLIKGVVNVRNAVYTHFSAHFWPVAASRPSMEGLVFRSLSFREGAALVKPFLLDEVKVAVWDCDNFKCLGRDGINFGFIKDFWDILKDDVMRF